MLESLRERAISTPQFMKTGHSYLNGIKYILGHVSLLETRLTIVPRRELNCSVTVLYRVKNIYISQSQGKVFCGGSQVNIHSANVTPWLTLLQISINCMETMQIRWSAVVENNIPLLPLC